MDDEQVLFEDLKRNYQVYYADLTAFIIFIAQNRYFWQKSTNTLPGGKTPEDIAQQIIFKVLNGDRKTYDPNKSSVKNWLRLQARSVINALVKSAIHRHESELPETEVFSDDYASDPEAEVIENEHQASMSKEVHELFQVADADLKEIIEAVVFNGCDPRPRYLAEALGTDRSDIYNRLKRLKRLAKREIIND